MDRTSQSEDCDRTKHQAGIREQNNGDCEWLVEEVKVGEEARHFYPNAAPLPGLSAKRDEFFVGGSRPNPSTCMWWSFEVEVVGGSQKDVVLA